MKMSANKSIKQYDFSRFQQEIKEFKIDQQIEKQKKVDTPKPNYSSKEFKAEIKKIKKVDINLADTIAFKSLPGIGTYFAKRICKYRNLLGGFHSKHQILEVYQMDSLRYAKIHDYLLVSEQDIVKRNINVINEADLRKHPYISYNLARSIVNYRQEHGDFESIDELNNLHLIDSLKFRKIAFYFTVDEHNQIKGKN